MNQSFKPRKLNQHDFPCQLLESSDQPKALWLAGSLPSPDTRILTVVGSRALTPYGKEACEFLIGGLRGYPISIVSGLALGADACAHRAALAAGLHTIAIPGSGLSAEVLYPRAHIGLANEILTSRGALISEHPPEYRAHPHDFPSRNRIMVGLAHAVLIIEAGERSGTILTARLAGESNRELLCVPHRIRDKHSYGTWHFVREGATLVTESEHILEALRIAPREATTPRASPQYLTKPEQLLLQVLDTPHTRDELLRAQPLATNEIFSTLILLELKGLIALKSGVWERIS